MIAITLWSSNGLRDAWRVAKASLQSIRPHAVQLHASPTGLHADAPALADAVRAAIPGVRIWLGVAGDAGHTLVPRGELSLDELWRRRLRVAATATRCGADVVVLNCEKAYKTGKPGFAAADARRWVTGLVEALPAGYPIHHTAYDQPTLHPKYTWSSFLGTALCVRSWPQVYWAEGGTGPNRLGAHRRSWETAVRKGWISQSCEVQPYLQLHGCAVRDLCTVADAFDDACFWAAGSRADAEGLRAAHALAEIERRGFAGPGRVRRFQASAGLVVDGLVGVRTLRALGL